MQSLTDIFKRIPELQLIRCWKIAVGEVIYSQTQFLGLRTIKKGKRCLFIRVIDPTWRFELKQQKDLLLEKYRIELSKAGVSEKKLPQDCIFSLKEKL